MTNVIGKPLPRVDGRAKVTGAARYAADFNQPGQAYAVIVSATVGLGRVTAIDTAPVEKMPGVVAVITHRNAPRLPYAPHKSYIDPATGERLHVLQDDHVRFYGQPAAMVVADTLDRAERAAAALRITYTAERPIIDPADPEARPVVPEAGKQPDARLPADTARGEPTSALTALLSRSMRSTNPRARIQSMERLARRGLDWQWLALEQEPVRRQRRPRSRYLRPAARERTGDLSVYRRSLRTTPDLPHVRCIHCGANSGRPVNSYSSANRFSQRYGPHLAAIALGRLEPATHQRGPEGTGETALRKFMEALIRHDLPDPINVRTATAAPIDIGTPNHMRVRRGKRRFASNCRGMSCYKLGSILALRRRNEPTMIGREQALIHRSIRMP